MIYLGDLFMNNYEVERLLSRMLENTKKIAIEYRVQSINRGLIIDKYSH